jgi:hypothetical protein
MTPKSDWSTLRVPISLRLLSVIAISPNNNRILIVISLGFFALFRMVNQSCFLGPSFSRNSLIPKRSRDNGGSSHCGWQSSKEITSPTNGSEGVE